MNRFQQAERLAAATREEIPKVAVRWLAAARAPLEKLTVAALDPDLTDEAFLQLVDGFSKSLPGLLDEMDHDALATLMEHGMGAGMANGISQRSAVSSQREEKRAKLPWETEVWLGAQRRRKNGQFGEGDGIRKSSHEWPAANAEEAGILSRISGRKFQAGARIHATGEGVRHAERNHAHQLTAKDWKQLKSRMFDQRTVRAMTRTDNREDAISFKFPRGADRMEAIFNIHFPHKKAPGELRLKTYAQRG
jgi:hypothetical protein